MPYLIYNCPGVSSEGKVRERMPIDKNDGYDLWFREFLCKFLGPPRSLFTCQEALHFRVKTSTPEVERRDKAITEHIQKQTRTHSDSNQNTMKYTTDYNNLIIVIKLLKFTRKLA